MSRWSEETRRVQFAGLRTTQTVRTDGTVLQVQAVETIAMIDGPLASFQEAIDCAVDGMEDVSIQFRPETDHQPADIRIVGWRALNEYEKSFTTIS